jgi:nucleoid-associated protein YgaU/3D (Asp-Asp-Asp) domain-containing protein
MEIKPVGRGIEELYAKAKIPNFFRKAPQNNFLEELRDRLGPALASAAPVKPEYLNAAPLKSAPTGSDPTAAGTAKAQPASADAETGEPAKAQAIHDEPVKASPAGRAVKNGGPADVAPVKTVPRSVLVVRNEPVAIEPAKMEPAKSEHLQTPLAMTHAFKKSEPVRTDPPGDEFATAAPVDVALLKTELLRGGAASETAVGDSLKAGPAITGPVEYIVKEGDSLWKIGRQLFKTDPYRIARDNGITNPNLIRPGQKLIINPAPPQAEPPQLTGEVTASWYGGNHHNKVTASGARFDMHKNTLAHKTLPLGTKVRLVNPDNGRFAEGVVTDRGPYIPGRDVDVSYAMAQKLGFVKKGVAKLDIETI